MRLLGDGDLVLGLGPQRLVPGETDLRAERRSEGDRDDPRLRPALSLDADRRDLLEEDSADLDRDLVVPLRLD